MHAAAIGRAVHNKWQCPVPAPLAIRCIQRELQAPFIKKPNKDNKEDITLRQNRISHEYWHCHVVWLLLKLEEQLAAMLSESHLLSQQALRYWWLSDLPRGSHSTNTSVLHSLNHLRLNPCPPRLKREWYWRYKIRLYFGWHNLPSSKDNIFLGRW